MVGGQRKGGQCNIMHLLRVKEQCGFGGASTRGKSQPKRGGIAAHRLRNTEEKASTFVTTHADRAQMHREEDLKTASA